jgi:phage shock protein C
MSENNKKLYRVEDGKMIAGVCAGLAEYFAIDVTIVRLGWVLLTLFVGCGILAYIIALIVMPRK